MRFYELLAHHALVTNSIVTLAFGTIKHGWELAHSCFARTVGRRKPLRSTLNIYNQCVVGVIEYLPWIEFKRNGVTVREHVRIKTREECFYHKVCDEETLANW